MIILDEADWYLFFFPPPSHVAFCLCGILARLGLVVTLASFVLRRLARATTMRRKNHTSLTQGAQQALRCTMEKYTNTTRFALACNTSSMIIEALQSRCAILRYQRLADEQILERLHAIVAAEKVRVSPLFSLFACCVPCRRLIPPPTHIGCDSFSLRDPH